VDVKWDVFGKVFYDLSYTGKNRYALDGLMWGCVIAMLLADARWRKN